MGLDNIPASYACKNQNVAVLDEEGRINCTATIESGKCPLHLKKDRDPILKDAVIPLGMFGTNCWYRGKYGSRLLEQMASFNPDFSYDGNTLYGHEYDDDSEGLTADECIDVSEEMFRFSESWVQYVKTESEVKGNIPREKELIDDWVYLAWWLKFVGEECEGMNSWY